MRKTKKKTSVDYLRMACAIAGGPSALAKEIGVTRQFMNAMLTKAKPIPLKRAILISKAVDYKIPLLKLRPDMVDIL